MMLHPQIIEKEGKKEFVLLPYEEFLQLQEQLEDYEDLKDLRCAKDEERDASTTPLSEVKKTLQQ
jgi:PHD/YefM family antitoxin component YafN of YafNO toxin-antitoxin module